MHKSLFTRNGFLVRIFITILKVYHCAKGDDMNNGENGKQTHFLSLIQYGNI